VLDVAGLLVFLVGLVVYGRAWLGFRGIPTYERPTGGTMFTMVELADGFRQLQHVGVGVMVCGIGVFVAAWWVAGRGQGSETTPSTSTPAE
jgi:hypothetical protein